MITLARQRSADTNVDFRFLDLANPASETDLSGIDTLIHAAAQTGKASRASFDAVNHLATRRLLNSAREANVRRVIYVSSIAARSPFSNLYPYARSKIAAEEFLRKLRISSTIVRPTLVLGPGSPIGVSLLKLTGLPVVPLFGGAGARLQPVDVDDLAEYVWKLVDDDGPAASVSSTVEIGGAETVTMRELLMRFCERAHGRRKKSVCVPVRWMLRPLYLAEPLLLKALPVTAGQLTGFICDGCCDPELQDSRFVPRHDLASMIERTIEPE